MRMIAAATLILLPLSAGAAQPAAEPPPSDAGSVASDDPSWPESFDRMNRYRTPPGCVSIRRQVAGEDREHYGTRLDRLPPGRLVLAVERQVDGCPEAALASDERRRERQRLLDR